MAKAVGALNRVAGVKVLLRLREDNRLLLDGVKHHKDGKAKVC